LQRRYSRADGLVRLLVPSDLKSGARAVLDIAGLAFEMALEIVSAVATDD
jgi:hypothetical protein